MNFTVETFESYDSIELRYAIMRSSTGNWQNEHRPIIFIPGLGGSVKNAISFLEHLVPEHGALYSLDARGFGLNENASLLPNPEDYLLDFNHFLAHLQDKESLSEEKHSPLLFGLSLGAIYATLYITDNWHPFKSLVLLAPAFSPNPRSFTFNYKLKNYFQVLLKGFKATTAMPYSIRDLTRSQELYEDPNFKEPLSLPSFYLLLVEKLCKRACAQTHRITIPTAMVIPEKDVICDPKAMRLAYNRISHPQKVILSYPELFHDIVQEPKIDQIKVCSDLNHWIASLETLSYEPTSFKAFQNSRHNS